MVKVNPAIDLRIPVQGRDRVDAGRPGNSKVVHEVPERSGYEAGCHFPRPGCLLCVAGAHGVAPLQPAAVPGRPAAASWQPAAAVSEPSDASSLAAA